MKKLFKISLLLLGIFLNALFCDKQTDRFAMVKISKLLLEHPSENVDLAPLNQPYFYYAKGGQSFIFISEDGRYILKFFRASRLDLLNQFNKVFSSLWLAKNIKRCETLLKNTYQSYLLAEENLKEETGLLGVHLGPSELPHLKLVDKIGIGHHIDLSLYPFILQKRTRPVKEHLQALLQNGKVEEARTSLGNLFLFLTRCIELGLQDGDPNLAKNFGFIDNHVIEFDAGNFKKGPPTFERIIASVQDLHYWMNETAPELSEELENQFETFMRIHDQL